jgi:hypothetical protein
MTRSRDTANIIPTVDAKGDLLVGTADNTIDSLSPGTNGQVLAANSATATGLEWITSVPVANGGTGATTLASGEYLKGAGTSAVTSQSGVPAADVTGTVAVGNGGTGATTLASGGYLKGSGTSAITSQSGIPAGDITSGTLGVGRGGTGAATLTSGAYLKGAGTSAVTAQSGIPAGDITSGTLPNTRGGTGMTDAILPRRTVAGTGQVAVDGNATISFPASRFSANPFVVITRIGPSGSGSYETPLITGISTTSFSLYINNANATFHYIAMQNQ